jgi:hypothetical protein
LRDERRISASSAVDQKLYFDHIRAVIVELVNIAIIKNQFTIIFYEDGQSKKQVITPDDIETRIQKATNLQVQLTNIQDAISKAG